MPTFRDVRVREAIGMMFDFEWINANYYSGLYRRTRSCFDESEFSSSGRPASAAEKRLLSRFPNVVREDVLEGRWRPPTHDGTARDRELSRRAQALLQAAGYALIGAGMVKDDAPLRFDILVGSRDEDRLALAFRHP
jgi:peptide/nickel transport system substrate-binding protein